jgi:hypothetical protein
MPGRGRERLADPAPLRYFYGLPWSKHIVIYDTLMEKSSPAEVEAVLAHELGHWYFCEWLGGFGRSERSERCYGSDTFEPSSVRAV